MFSFPVFVSSLFLEGSKLLHFDATLGCESTTLCIDIKRSYSEQALNSYHIGGHPSVPYISHDLTSSLHNNLSG